MVSGKNNPPTKLLLIPLIFIFSLTSCGLPNNSGEEQQAEVTLKQDLRAPASMGFIQDPKGNPISYATITGEEFSDLNGLLMSTTKTYVEEWAVVKAAGYATGFAQAKETFANANVFHARLTPFSTAILIDTDINQSIGTGDLRDPEIAVFFPQGGFNSLPVVARLAEVNPIHIGPLFEPLDSGQKLHLQRAFGLQALNSQMENTSLASGITLEIVIRDNGELAEPITIATFDPNEGIWKVLSKACTRNDDTHILCEIDQISPLIGLFTEQEFLWMPDLEALQVRGSGLSGLMAPKPKPLSGNFLQSGGCDGPVAEAMDQQLMDYQVIIGDLLQQGANLNSDTMADLMNNYSNLAFAYADLCKNEKGKAALLRIMDANLRLGLQFGDNWAYDPSRATDEIKELSTEIAQKALVEGKCIDIPEALNAVREARLLGVSQESLTEGGTESIDEAFARKSAEWAQDCDIWMGAIRIFHYPGALSGLEDHTALSVDNVWAEIHDVRISTHPETQAITGRSKVNLLFPPIMYSRTSDKDPCHKNDLIVYYGFPSEQMEVKLGQENSDNSVNSENQVDPDLIKNYEEFMKDPQSLTSEQIAEMQEALEALGDLAAQPTENLEPSDNSSPGSYDLEYGFDITFGGFYDGTAFSISDLVYNCYAEIIQYQHSESEENDECIVTYDMSIPVHNYSSYLAHGLYGSPPINLQEILDAPVLGDHIGGCEKFSNPHPEIGSYPLDTTHVTWDLVHVQNQEINEWIYP
jgi:hypothetical protein